MWNVIAVSGQDHGADRTNLTIKLVVVAISGLAAFLPARARSTAPLAIFGALSAASALAALFLGVLLSQ